MIRIIADSTCSLSEELVKKYRIMIASHKIVIDGQEADDNRSEVADDDFYAKAEMEEMKPPIAPTAMKYVDLFTKGVRNGDLDFIVITMSKNGGGSYNSAIKARDLFLIDIRIEGIRIAVIDSKNLTAGYGYLVMKTAKLRDEGVSFEDLVEFAEKYKTRIKGYVCVSDALSLAKMGYVKTGERRIKKVTDNMIMLGTDNKGMGIMLGHADAIDQVYKVYGDEFAKQVDLQLTDFIIIEYSSELSRAQELKEYMRKNGHFHGEIYICRMSPSSAINLGLGAVGMAYAAKSQGDSFLNLFRRVGAATRTSSAGVY